MSGTPVTGLPYYVSAAAPAPGFTAFSAMHFWTVMVCLAVMVVMTGLGGVVQRRSERAEWWLRHIYGWLCFGVWGFSVTWYMQRVHFVWKESLPLQFCDMGLLVAGGVLLTRARWLRGLLYFWTCTFTVQAFLTPVLDSGPTSMNFALFWLSHTMIAGPALYDVVVGKFRPQWSDAVRSYVISFFYAALLMIVDNLTGWNYGYVGPTKPGARTILDVLGDYPLRVLWMVLIASFGFLLVWLPWGIGGRERGTKGSRDRGIEGEIKN